MENFGKNRESNKIKFYLRLFELDKLYNELALLFDKKLTNWGTSFSIYLEFNLLEWSGGRLRLKGIPERFKFRCLVEIF